MCGVAFLEILWVCLVIYYLVRAPAAAASRALLIDAAHRGRIVSSNRRVGDGAVAGPAPARALFGGRRDTRGAEPSVGVTHPLCWRYFIAKKLGRFQSGDAPTTAMVRTEPRMSRM